MVGRHGRRRGERETNDAIDILAVAAARYHAARERVRYAGMLNSSPSAAVFYRDAIADWQLADLDRTRAQWLLLELSRLEQP